MRRLQSFKYAFNGLIILLKEEPNSRIHFFIALLTVFISFYLKITALEWLVILICIGWVFSMELLNTSIENLADFSSKEKHSLIKKAKDLAAAAVLISAITSIVIAFIIYIPRIKMLISN